MPTTTDDRFEGLPLGSTDETKGSPPEPAPDAGTDDWSGIVIDGPASVHLEAGDTPGTYAPLPPIPICGRVKLLVLETPTDESVRLLAYGRSSKLRYSGTTGEDSPDDPEHDPEERLDDELFEGVLATTFFHVDAVEVLSLPSTPETYEIRARLGDVTSNVHVLEVKARDPDPE